VFLNKNYAIYGGVASFVAKRKSKKAPVLPGAKIGD